MALDVNSILSRVESHASALGLFERVNTHEPKNAPGNGLTAAIWSQRIDPIPEASGMNETTGRLLFQIRIFTNMLQEPQDAIDPNVMSAVSDLMGAYSADFTLGDTIKQVDLRGAHGIALSGQAGYIKQDSKLFRVYDINLPLIVNDIWSIGS